MHSALLIVHCHIAGDRFAEAVRMCEKLLNEDGHDAGTSDLLAVARQGLVHGSLDAEARFRFAVALQRAGLYREAESEYLRILELLPDAPEAHSNLGAVRQALGRLDDAAVAFEQALRLRPDYARALSNLGAVRAATGRPIEARALLERALTIEPNHPSAWTHLGTALRALGDIDAAIAAHRRSIALEPCRPEAHLNLAHALAARNDREGAAEACDVACRLRPGWIAARLLRANLLHELGRSREAASALRELNESTPSQPEIALALSTVTRRLGCPDEAERVVRRALAHDPDHRGLRLELARSCAAARRLDEARDVYAALLAPAADAALWAEYGEYLLGEGGERTNYELFSAGIEALERAHEFAPEDPQIGAVLGVALAEAGRWQESEPHLERAVAATTASLPAIAMLLEARARGCVWHDYDALCATLRTGIETGGGAVPPMRVLARFDDPALSRLAARRFAATLGLETAPRRLPFGRSRLRVGYLSGDFGDHPVGRAIAPVVEQHDRTGFEIIGIATQPGDGSASAQRARQAFDSVAELAHLGPSEFDRAMRELDCDVLVDLAGLTLGARPRALAIRSAGVQVSYLGYPGTGGAPWVDYLVADRFVIPPEQRAHYDEKIACLPDCFLPGEVPADPGPAWPRRADAGLPDDRFVFCNLTQWHRLNPEVFDSFLRILRRAPESVLWLRDPGPAAAARLRDRASAAGVDGARLFFAVHAATHAEHRARLQLADLFLDSRPYNGHTTAHEALASGVPLLTLSGASFAARVAGSLLTSVGLPNLITGSAGAFEDHAAALAGDPRTVRELRARLAVRSAASSAFNPARQARQLEAAYAMMHARWQRGQEPDDIAVEALS